MAALHLEPAFFWREIALVTSNGIKNKKVEEKRKSMRQEARKFEKFKRRKPREKPRKKKKKRKLISVKITVAAERNRA